MNILPQVTEADRKAHPFLQADESIQMVLVLNSLTNEEIMDLLNLREAAITYDYLRNLFDNIAPQAKSVLHKLFVLNTALTVAQRRNLITEYQAIAYWNSELSWQNHKNTR